MRSDLGNLLKALGRLDEAKVCYTDQMQLPKAYIITLHPPPPPLLPLSLGIIKKYFYLFLS